MLALILWGSATAATDEASKNTGFWQALKGTAFPNSLYAGMWTYHINASSRKDDNANNELLGFVYKSIFAGTFLNSYGERSYAVGVQRNLYAHQFTNHPDWHYYVGYRAGAIYGYDSRLSHFAGESPIIPYASLMTSIRYKHFGWEVSYTAVVFSTSFYFAF